MQSFLKLLRAEWKAAFFVVASCIGLLAILFSLPVTQELLSRASYAPAQIYVDADAIIGPLPRPWRNLAQGGEDHEWRIAPIAGKVAALNPEYIRVDHIYDFYDIVSGSPGNWQFDFSELDVLLDDIAATGAKPYIALSYTPTEFTDGDIVSAPQSYADWSLLVQRTVEHVSGTRGTSDVYYEVWNEPDLFGGWKYYGQKNYLDLYRASALGAQRARGVQPFKIGGPATTDLYLNWMNAIADLSVDENIRLDFVSWHVYSRDLNYFRETIDTARRIINANPAVNPNIEFHITEWGHDSENDAGYDGVYSAAHTAAAAITLMQPNVRSFVFEIEDGRDPEGKEYWGRWGMLTHQDFGAKPKPRYYSLLTLERLPDMRLETVGDGTYVKAIAATASESEHEFEMVLANFDERGRNVETVPIRVSSLPDGVYTASIEYLDGRRSSTEFESSENFGEFLVSMPPLSVAHVVVE